MGIDGIGSSPAYHMRPDFDDAPPPSPPAATATINGNDGDSLGRFDGGFLGTPLGRGYSETGDRQTTDGKAVQQDTLFSNDNVSITRERTYKFGDDTNGDGIADPYATADQLVVSTNGHGDDRVEVRSNDDGTTDLYVNGERYPVSLAPGQEITLRTGDGNDTVMVDSDVQINIVVESGAGDDFIMTGAGNDRIDAGDGNDTVYAGEGRDDVFGNSGDDHLSGGDGNDVVYGGDGNDFMTGTAGNDYLEGGAGDDTIWGGADNDIVSGGRGNDRLEGDAGNDTVYTGLGADTVINGGGTDTVYAQTAEDSVTIGQYADTGSTSNVVVNVVVSNVQGVTVDSGSSAAFQQRVNADLDMLRASPSGQQLLTALEVSGHTGNPTTIRELQNEQNGFAAPGSNWQDGYATASGPGSGTSSTVYYNPGFHTDPSITGNPGFSNPVIVLNHELAHSYNQTTGTLQPGQYTGNDVDGTYVYPDGTVGINNLERQAVGLPTSPTEGTANPEWATENGLREEMGLPDRPFYVG